MPVSRAGPPVRTSPRGSPRRPRRTGRPQGRTSSSALLGFKVLLKRLWANTGHEAAVREQAERDGRPTDGDFDLMAMFFHDVPPEVTEQAMAQGDPTQSNTPFEQPLPFETWPDVPTRVLLARDDRFFPAEFQRRIAIDRLGITPDEMPGGHLVALSRPKELTDRLLVYQGQL